MSRVRCAYRCRRCGVAAGRWAGRCVACGEWNSLVEEAPQPPPAPVGDPVEHRRLGAHCAPGSGVPAPASPVCLGEVDLSAAAPRPTGLAELDRVLGGGLVPGSVTLLGGEPGVGKSTLLLQVLRAQSMAGTPALLVCAEESARQVRLRAERLGPIPPALFLLADTDVTSVAGAVADTRARLVVVDSVQAVRDPATAGPAGSVAQVRACAEMFVALAKHGDVALVLVGHVTKDGALAGPRLLEHVVDTVLTVEGDRHHSLRTVRAVKHRFGATGELGLFEMGESGLGVLSDPYRLLLGDRRPGQPGAIVLPAVEGRRPLLVEVQALVAGSAPGAYGPRRQALGLDGARLALLLAVLERGLGVPLSHRDVFASVVGGIRVAEPAADLAVAVALSSAARWQAVAPETVAFGEVGLGGEVRHVPHARRRLEEAARMGFRRALVPASCCDGPGSLQLVRVGSLSDLAGALAA